MYSVKDGHRPVEICHLKMKDQSSESLAPSRAPKKKPKNRNNDNIKQETARTNSRTISQANCPSTKDAIMRQSQHNKVIEHYNVVTAQPESEKLTSVTPGAQVETDTRETTRLINESDNPLSLTPQNIKQLFKELQKGDGCMSNPCLPVYTCCDTFWSDTSDEKWLDNTIKAMECIYNQESGWIVHDKTITTAIIQLLLFQFILFKSNYYDSLSNGAKTALVKLENFQQSLWLEFYMAHGSKTLLNLPETNIDPKDCRVKIATHKRVKQTLVETWTKRDRHNHLPSFLQNFFKSNKNCTNGASDIESHLCSTEAQKNFLAKQRELLPYYKKYASNVLMDFPKAATLSGFHNLKNTCFASPAMLISLFFYPVISMSTTSHGDLEPLSIKEQLKNSYRLIHSLFWNEFPDNTIQDIYHQLLSDCMALQASGETFFFENNDSVLNNKKLTHNPKELKPDNPTSFMTGLLELVAEEDDLYKYAFELKQIPQNTANETVSSSDRSITESKPLLNQSTLNIVIKEAASKSPNISLQWLFDQILKTDSGQIDPYLSVMAVDTRYFKVFTVCFQFGFSDILKEFTITESILSGSCEPVDITVYDIRSKKLIKIRFEKVATIFHGRKYPEYNTFENLGDHYRTSIKLNSEEHKNNNNKWFLFDDANVFKPMENQTDSDEHFDCGLPIAMVFNKLV